ncbi:MAG: efflux RND transporter permease subunit [Candidatus Eisenbacteria sp.]|nr:efflux RND transporter permease subunit [Candidatus Eisenbacteria bacterium]
MNLPEFAVHRRVTVLMLFLALMLFGMVSLLRLPVDLYPEIELPAITIITLYPGAGPNDVESRVTEVIEDAVSTVSNLRDISSASRDNVSAVTARFDWQTDLDEVSNEIRDRLELVTNDLPSDIQRSTILKMNTAMMPVLVYGAAADESYGGLRRIMKDNVGEALKQIPGVGSLIVLGGVEREIQVTLQPNRMAAYGIPYTQIAGVLAAENVNIPAGSIKIGRTEYMVRLPGEFADVSEIRRLIVGQSGGRVIHLADVAEVSDGFKEPTMTARANGRPGVVMIILKQSGANTVEVARSCRARMAELRQTLPSDIEIVEIIDGAEFITRSIRNLSEAVVYGGIFVVLVVFAFLRRFRASVIIALAIPFSVIMAFLVLHLYNYTLNMVSLMSLAVVIGMVVDDAIVVLENITRHTEEGERPREAAAFGASEVGLAVMASALTVVAVFAPMMFATGLIGTMFKQLAFIVIVTVLTSFFASQTLTPMLSSFLLRRADTREGLWNRFFRTSERGFVALEEAYGRALGWVLAHKRLTVSAAVIVLGASLSLVTLMKTEFLPTSDTGDIQFTVELTPGTRIEHSEEMAERIEALLQEDIPEMVNYYTMVGQEEMGILSLMGREDGPHVVSGAVKLVDRKCRRRSSEEIAHQLGRELEKIPGIAKMDIGTGSILQSALFAGAKPISIEVRGHDMAVANQLAEEIKGIVKRTPGATGARIRRGEKRAEFHVVIDREKAARLGLNAAIIGQALRSEIYGVEATTFREGGEEYGILLRAAAEKRQTIEDIENLVVPSLTGLNVRLKNVASIEEGASPTVIFRENRERVVRVDAGLYGRALGEVVADIRSELAGIEIPPDVAVEFGGEVEEQRKAFSNLLFLLILGIALVYMVMASQFESFLDPFVVMFAIPFALVGVLWAFFVTGTTLSLVSFVGIIMLMGIVVKNAIVLVDYTNILRSRGLELGEAVRVAGRHRLRPVLMTAFTTMFGVLPLALSRHEGSEVWRPLGITIIGGLLVSSLVTLILVPTIYAIFEARLKRFAGDRR